MAEKTDAQTTASPSAPRKSLDPRLVKILAAATGLLGFLAAILTPILPVNQTTADLEWPQNDSISDVVAPLVAYVPTEMSVTVPCSLAAELPESGGVLLSTLPERGRDATARGLFIRATEDAIAVTDRDLVILQTDRAAAQSAADCRIVFNADGEQVTAAIEGIDGTAGNENMLEFSVPDPDMRPQIVGVYSDLPETAPRDGLSLRATIDTRYVNTATPLKLAVIIAGIILTILSLISLGILDSRDGRSHRRFFPPKFFTIRPSDAVVFLVLAAWWFMGANTSDDGYNFVVSRIAGEAGYADNYFRYFGVPQDPFGWHYKVLAAMTEVNLSTPWMRLPAFLLGLLGWWLISREVIPRLGRTVRHSTPALWAAALVYLAFWMPYNNGIRPEPALAVGALLTWCCVERSIATRRLLPYAIGVIAAAFTLALAPGGLMAVAALLAGIRPVIKTVTSRIKRDGLLPMIAPILAAGTFVLFQIFWGHTLSALIVGNQVASDVGPTLEWWQEPTRYYYLILQTGDGTLSRRYGVLIMILCLMVVIFRLLRKQGLVGIARAPIWRLVAVTIGTMFFISFTPTKWTHHFGLYAGIAGALAAAAAALMSPVILRSRRNRTFFAALVLLIVAVSFAGTNMWWYVGSYGIPWWDRPPSIAGINLSWVFLLATLITALVGLYFHFRDDYVSEDVRTGRAGITSKLRISPLPVLSAFMVVFMLLSYVKGAWEQRDSFSWASSNARALQGDICGLANDVMVEADPNAAMLTPAAVAGRPAPDVSAALAGQSRGFDPNGLPSWVPIDPLEESSDASDTDNGDDATDDAGSDTAIGDIVVDDEEQTQTTVATGTRGPGVNGSTTRLPFGLDPATTPVLGSDGGETGTAELTSDWYQLPFNTSDGDEAHPLITLAVAGSVQAADDQGLERSGQDLWLEYGRLGPDGQVIPLGTQAPLDITKSGSTWRNLRFPIDAAPRDADIVRIEVRDASAAPGEWLAITPPRAPELRTLNEVVGSQAPVLIDWMVGLVFPCQRPIAVRNGVLEVPEWRIMPDAHGTRQNSQTWMAGTAGGPLGITDALLTSTLVPTYLRNNWGRDWGGLQRYTEIAPAPPAELIIGTEQVSGLYNPAPMRSSGY